MMAKVLICVFLLMILCCDLVQATLVEDLLARVERQAELFVDQVSSYTCMESVVQEKLDAKGHAEFRQRSLFAYWALPKFDENNLIFEEWRDPQGKPSKKSDQPPLLNTAGFSAVIMIFHPVFRPHFKRWIDREKSGDGLACIRFEQLPGGRSPVGIMIRERPYPLHLHGCAWVDPQSGIIRKISAGLIAPMKDINVESISVEALYERREFLADAEEKWLPSSAVIEFQTAHQRWKNSHSYSQYKRFDVHVVEASAK
jgi:hypothetical protein